MDWGTAAVDSSYGFGVPEIASQHFSEVTTHKKQLQLLLENHVDDHENHHEKLLLAACDGDIVTLESILRTSPHLVDEPYPREDGVTPLIYAVCYDQHAIAEALLFDHRADPDKCDTLSGLGFTPFMWAVHLDLVEMARLLLNYQADPYVDPRGDGTTAVTLLNPEKEQMYAFFRLHNITMVLAQHDVDPDVIGSLFGHGGYDDLDDKLRLQMTGMTLQDHQQSLDDHYASDSDSVNAESDPHLVNVKDFEYDRLVPAEYIKFTDSDIPLLLDYIFSLHTRNTTQHNTRIPAAVAFQLIRYSHLKVHSSELTTFFFDCFLTRLRLVTHTTLGVLGDDSGSAGRGDIVLVSYWLLVVHFLHFYLSKNQLYKAYPQFLQELVNATQLLIATLSSSINARLETLVDDCMLRFTSLVDVSNVTYAKDWNLFKKKKTHPNTYDDVLDMLYPPSQSELMKPLPIRYIQVLGALDYVLNLHDIHPLVRMQTMSQVFYTLNATIFNRIITQSKLCTRAKAIQIRLNVLAVEDWLRSHNFKVPSNMHPGLNGEEVSNLLRWDKDGAGNDPHTLNFYYDSLFAVCRRQLLPTVELLQWLQCMSSLADEDSLITTINQFDALNYYQLVKVVKIYKYEVDETKFPKELNNILKALQNEQGENQIARSHLHYMTQSNFLLKELYVALNPNFVFAVALPNLEELISTYGPGLGGIKTMRARKYQPSLPMEIADDIDDILTKNKATMNDTYDYEEEENDDSGSNETKSHQEFKGDELFKSVQLPSSLLHKNWGDDDLEANPW